MLTHLVLFRYHDATDAAARDDHRDRLRALTGVVPELHTLTVGADVMRTERSYDTALVATFGSRDALARYDAHPAHRDAAALGRALCSSIVACDTED